ncbi:MAG: multidrug effflux MFS transporter [Chthoniobacterales bacterium]
MNNELSKLQISRGYFIFLLASLSMLTAVTIDVYLPSFASMAADFETDIASIQQTLTIYLSAMAIMTLFHGTLSDSFGRRPVILTALSIYTLASLAAAFADSLLLLLLCRFVQGLSAGAGMVVGRAMIRDVFAGAKATQTLSYVTVIFGVGPVFAPIIGGWLEFYFGWQSTFLFMAAFGIFLLITCGLHLPESLPRQERSPLHPGNTLRDYLKALKNRRLIMRSLAVSLTSGLTYIYVSAAPAFVMQILGLPETSFAWLFVPLVLGMMSGAFLSGQIAALLSPSRILGFGFAVITITSLWNILYSAFYPPSVPWSILPLALQSFGTSFVIPVMTLHALDALPERRGMASSLQAALSLSCFTLCSGLLVPLIFHSALLLALAAAACSFLSIVIAIFDLRKCEERIS